MRSFHFRLICPLLVALALAACSEPYRSPVIVKEPGQHPTAEFPGLKELIVKGAAVGAPAQVLWTHGMCTHEDRWAQDRIGRLQAALGVVPTITPRSTSAAGEPYYINARFDTPSGSLTTTFLIWSPMTAAYKQTLSVDAPGTNGDVSFPYQRATLNGKLKTGLVNDCLSDAVVYAGRNGDPIRGAMQQAVCNFLGGVDPDGICDLSGATADRPTAIITESLGSKFIFDAVRAIWNQARNAPTRGARLDRRLAAISTVYLAANQIPLLDIANPLPLTRGMSPSSLGSFVDILNFGRSTARQRPLYIVDFSDPNDLLTYRMLPKGVDVLGANLVNVTVSNDETYFDFLERPDTAHCGYVWNPDVVGLIINGYHGGPVPTAPVTPSSSCL